MSKIFMFISLFLFFSSAFSQIHNAELVSQKTIVELKKGKLIKTLHYEIRINNRSGEKYSKITIPYSKINKIQHLKASVKDQNGNLVRTLKKDEIVDKSYISHFSFYEDNFIKEFTIRHNTFPYTIVYSYQITQSEFIDLVYWIPVLDKGIPTLHAELSVTVPDDFKISFRYQHTIDPVIDTIGRNIIYQWRASYQNTIKKEVLSPPVVQFLPTVKIVPENFQYDLAGSFKNWVSFGNWQNDLLKDINELPLTEKSRVLDLVRDIPDVKEKIKRLYYYLQDETRYINVTIETGGLKPYPASYVVNNKYGDCKALTNYFKAILDFLQIPSFYTKINAGNPITAIDTSFPSQQSNHIILYIPYENEDIWLDCTSDFSFNYLGTFTQNRDAFVISKDESVFMKTPSLHASDVFVSRNIDINYSRTGTEVIFDNTYRGESFEMLFHIHKYYNEFEKARILRQNIVPDGFQLNSFLFDLHHRDSALIRLNFNATSQKIYDHIGHNLLVRNIPFDLPKFEKPENRKLPVQIDYPIFETDTLRYEIPSGYQSRIVQNNFNIHTKFGNYTLSISNNSDKIMVVKRILIHAGIYPLAEYKEIYDFYLQVAEIEHKTHITLTKDNHYE